MPLSARERISRLTPQQRRVALLLGQGLTYAAIADRLSLSPHTIHEHIAISTNAWAAAAGSKSSSCSPKQVC